ncbi:hypothetical protein CALVIDRAFT_536500 [Calocera viscosa TUFC12733]|uniref:Nucleoside diphosphate kinase n=1 Tax=Calocera viscosa (strain TUFC12733) TaxID=1330018 RepID=A0A167MT32_CALVF|nr:hypothetical protein CALVIDRAFT_536500 [Calocera viscosa TUFC12733]
MSTTTPSSSPSRVVTRTIAILKPNAVKHRLTIEPRLVEAGFEIVKERQVEFQQDDAALEDLFGRDGPWLADGPVWVYVLERRRAVEVLNTLMGPEDPNQARNDAPKSLRAIYGRSLTDNAIFGSHSNDAAERQISILFASSPPFRAADLANDIPLPASESDFSLNPSNQATPDRPAHKVLADPGTPESLVPSSNFSGQSQSVSPTRTGLSVILPRQNRASLLRTGSDQLVPAGRPKRIHTSDDDAVTFADVPGHKFRSVPIVVASTAPPATAPRQNRAAALRAGQPVASLPVRERKAVEYDGTPGHKRSQTFSVVSTKAPAVAPRLNRAAALRLSQGGVPGPAARAPAATSAPTAYRGRSSSSIGMASNASSTPSRSSSVARPPSSAGATGPAAQRPKLASRTGSAAPPSSFRGMPTVDVPETPVSRPGTAPGTRPSLTTRASTASLTGDKEETPAKPPSRPASVMARPPSITPRMNRSASLRVSMGGTAAPTPSRPKPKVTPSTTVGKAPPKKAGTSGDVHVRPKTIIV